MGRDVDLLVAANVFWGMGTGFYAFLLPLYVAQLGAAPAQIGFVLALTGVVQALVYIPAGLLADRVGRKQMIVGGWALGPLAMLVFLAAQTWQQLIPGIVLLAAVAWCAPAYHAYIATAAGQRDMSHAFLMMFVGVTLGMALSAPASGWLAATAGLRWTFAGALVAFSLSTAIVALLRPQLRSHREVGEPVVTPHVVAATRRRRPLTEVWTPPLAAALALTSGTIFAANLGQPLAPNWLADRYGFSAVDIGRFGSASALGGAVLGIALGRLQRRHGTHWALPVAAAALLGYTALLLVAANGFVAVAAYSLRGVYTMLPSLAVAVVARVLAEQRPNTAGRPGGGRMELGFAVYNTGNAIAVTLSTYAAGWLYGVHGATPFALSAGLLCVVIWMSWTTARRGPAPTTTIGG
jgi:MFS family permease